MYVAAAVDFLLGRPLAYAVTAKGKLTSGDSLATFRPHLVWLAASVALLVGQLGFGLGSPYPTLTFWLSVTALTCAVPLVLHGKARIQELTVEAPSPQREIRMIEQGQSVWHWWDAMAGAVEFATDAVPVSSLESQMRGPTRAQPPGLVIEAVRNDPWHWWHEESRSS